MRVDIYTCSFGAGHRAGAARMAKLLEEAFEVTILDSVEEAVPSFAPVLYETYKDAMTKQGGLYKTYLKADKVKKNLITLAGPLRHRFNEAVRRRPLPDVFVATYSIAAHLLSRLKKKDGLCTPLVTLITDFEPHELWINEMTDLYVVLSETTKKSLEDLGVCSEKILLLEREAHEVRPMGETLHILLSGGGLGLLPEDVDSYRHLEESTGASLRILSGVNHDLRQRLQRAGFEALGFQADMKPHLAWADVIVGKAGGQSILEAMEWGLPFGYFTPFLPQEVRNGQFLEETGMGFEVDVDEMGLPSRKELLAMQERMLASRPKDGEIVKRLKGLVHHGSSLTSHRRLRPLRRPQSLLQAAHRLGFPRGLSLF